MKLADEDAVELAAGVDAETAGGEEFLVVALGAEPGVADVEGTDAFQVQITINGESNAKYMETVDLSQPLSKNMDWVAVDENE